MNTKRLGDKGEAAAAKALKRQGYKILAANVRTGRGEIDLIARHQGQIVFIEVKSRTGHSHGSPQAAVDGRKQARLTRLAEEWLVQNDMWDHPARFDVVAVTVPAEGKPKVEVFANAFDARH